MHRNIETGNWAEWSTRVHTLGRWDNRTATVYAATAAAYIACARALAGTMKLNCRTHVLLGRPEQL